MSLRPNYSFFFSQKCMSKFLSIVLVIYKRLKSDIQHTHLIPRNVVLFRITTVSVWTSQIVDVG